MAKRPAMLVLPGGAYMFCSDREAEPVALADGSIVDDAFVLTATDTMLYTAYATFAGVVVAMVYGVIRNALK